MAPAVRRPAAGLDLGDGVSPSLRDRPDRRAALAALHPAVTFADGVEAAVAGADVVLLCTSSGTPVLPTALIGETRAGDLDQHQRPPRARGRSPAFLLAADVFCDLRTSGPLAAGEMLLAMQRHGWSADAIVADLPELLAGTVSADAHSGRPRFFRSIGLGIEDLAVASLLVDGGATRPGAGR